MDITFRITPDTTPDQYRRAIAAMVVLGDLRLDAPASREEIEAANQLADWACEPPTPATPDAAADPWDPATPEQVLADMEAAREEMGRNPPLPPAPPLPEPGKTPLTPTGDDEPTNDGQGLDANGLPWDARIHAGTKVKNADGSWRARRGVDPELVESVTAELRRVQGLTVTPPPPPAPEDGADDGAPLLPPAPPAPPAPPTPPAPPAPPAPEGSTPTTPAELLQWAARAGKTPAQCAEACRSVGLVDAEGNGQISLVLARPDAVAAVYEALA